MALGVAATLAPMAEPPSHSRRIRMPDQMMRAGNRTRTFRRRLEMRLVEPVDDTGEAAAEVMRRSGV